MIREKAPKGSFVAKWQILFREIGNKTRNSWRFTLPLPSPNARSKNDQKCIISFRNRSLEQISKSPIFASSSLTANANRSVFLLDTFRDARWFDFFTKLKTFGGKIPTYLIFYRKLKPLLAILELHLTFWIRFYML